ncbi:MAG: hypothetical protein FWF14_05020 [Streptococcaceae bacterium]|jgi:heme/copper-type cytochrome/quinol oxidase subunit 2|nr:hypothetical protein [Streptococcaceae bacterium]
MANLSTLPLAFLFIGTIVVAYIIAWFYRNDYEPRRYLKAYLIYGVPLLIVGLILHVKIILIIGIYLFGSIVLVFRNQHYFDKNFKK